MRRGRWRRRLVARLDEGLWAVRMVEESGGIWWDMVGTREESNLGGRKTSDGCGSLHTFLM